MSRSISTRFVLNGTPQMATGFKRGASFTLMGSGEHNEAYVITRRGGWKDGRLTIWARPRGEAGS